MPLPARFASSFAAYLSLVKLTFAFYASWMQRSHARVCGVEVLWRKHVEPRDIRSGMANIHFEKVNFR